MKVILSIILSIVTLFISVWPVQARTLLPADISVPEGYKVEIAVDNLASPTMVAFDDQGRMLIAESGYDGSGEPKVIRIEKDGSKTSLTKDGVFAKEVPVTAVTFYQGKIYVIHGGTVSIIQDGGTLNDIITGLPGRGDHQANQLVFKDGKMYVGIGTVTNSAVVGPDNVVFGWLTKSENKELHDIPCQDVKLSDNAVFESDDVAGHDLPKTKTSAYSPFGVTQSAGTVIKGDVKCNGAVLTANPDGTDLAVYAWGLRNPYGLQIGPNGALYISVHGFDARGSRPIENAWDCIYKVERGKWYGWPDFACDVPVTDPQFKTKDKPQPEFLITNHPTENPPKPIAKFPPHAAANGFSFAKDGWGKPTDMFLALFGDFTPATGSLTKPQGIKIVRVDTTNGQISDFLVNKVPGQASKHSAGGLEHPSSVTFGPDGAMYIADWGVVNITVDGLKLDPNSGVIWKVTKVSDNPETSVGIQRGGPSLIVPLLGLVMLLGLSIFLGKGKGNISVRQGGLYGVIAGAVMGVFTLFVSKVVLNLPWYAPTSLFASMVMGKDALANILEFNFLPFIVGLIVLLILTGILGAIFSFIGRTSGIKEILSSVLYALAGWIALQYFFFPLAFPIIVEKGFPPIWFALTFGVYGLTLGVLQKKIG